MNYIEEINDIETLVGENLADASNITAAELRDTFAGFIAFLRKTSPLANGGFWIGDVEADDVLRTVNLPYNVGTSEYRVEGNLISNAGNYNDDNDVILTIRERTPTYFKICLREVSRNGQSLSLDWAIYPKNT